MMAAGTLGSVWRRMGRVAGAALGVRALSVPGWLAAMALVTPLLGAPPPSPSRPADKPAPALHLLDLDTAPTVGKPLTIRARLDDPRGAVFGVRFTVNGRAGAEILTSKGLTDYSEVTTPVQAGRVAILAEALDDSEKVLARDIVWVKATSPYTEKVEVLAAPVWGDLIPKESLLHQHPVVSVHSYAAIDARTPDDRFGPNQRPVHVLFLVDGKGFGERLPSILQALTSIGAPGGRILRERDEVGLLVIGDTTEVRRDFKDGSIRQAVVQLGLAGGAGSGSVDMGLLLRAIVSASSVDVSTAGIIVTNGIHWGTLFRHKALAGENEGDYLLTVDDIQDIRARAWEKDISFSTIAVSTPEYPLAMDANRKMSFEPLERKLNEALAHGADASGQTSAAHAATFNVYIRQMFDLLATLSAATGAEHGVRLATEKPESLREQAADILQPVVGRFQRRDFEVFETAPGAACPEAGHGQILEGVSARSRDKLLLAIAVDRSLSTNITEAAHDIQTALRAIVHSIRPQDCLLIYAFSAFDADRVSNCIDSEEAIDLASGQIIGGSNRSQGTDIFGSAFTIANNMRTLEVYAGEQGGRALDPGQEVDKAIVILTDGWQTRDTIDAMAAVNFLKKQRIRVFEVLIEGDVTEGRQIAGWSLDTGGSLLPPNGVALKRGETGTAVPQLITSVYWGLRDVYRVDYTSSSPEKEYRDVCMRIKGRPDLYLLREGGTGYRADKSAYAHLFRMIEDPALPLASRRQALEAAARLGTEFEFRRVSSYAEGDEAALRVPAFVAALAMSTRLGMPGDRIEKLYGGMETPARMAAVTALEGRVDCDETVVERLLVAELRRPAERTTEELRWEALVALGRLNGGLSNETLRTLGTLVQAAGTSPSLREGARKLLESAKTPTPHPVG